MRIYFLIVGMLAVWRIAHLLSEESGPAEIFIRVRRFAGNGFWGQLLGCFYCMSLWVAAPLAWLLGEGWKERALLWPAFSGAAILLERISAERPAAARGFYVEEAEEEVEDEHVLR